MIVSHSGLKPIANPCASRKVSHAASPDAAPGPSRRGAGIHHLRLASFEKNTLLGFCSITMPSGMILRVRIRTHLGVALKASLISDGVNFAEERR